MADVNVDKVLLTNMGIRPDFADDSVSPDKRTAVPYEKNEEVEGFVAAG